MLVKNQIVAKQKKNVVINLKKKLATRNKKVKNPAKAIVAIANHALQQLFLVLKTKTF